jgi:hypothetical protein
MVPTASSGRRYAPPSAPNPPSHPALIPSDASTNGMPQQDAAMNEATVPPIPKRAALRVADLSSTANAAYSVFEGGRDSALAAHGKEIYA